MVPADIPLLRRSRLLAAIPETDLARLLVPCFAQTLPRGAALCQQGEAPQFLHIVLSGAVGLFGAGQREEMLVEFFGPGDSFILAAVVLDAPYLLNARLLERSRVLLWPAAAFRAELRSHGALAHGAALQSSIYWRTLIGQIKDLKLLTAIERLTALLLALAPARTGGATVTLPAGRRLIAGRLGITPQSLSRAFAALRPAGVSGEGRRVVVADLDRLRDVLRPAESR
jgi:CRP/FNR family transcriptional activator FtrB